MSLWSDVEHDPYLWITTGTVIGVLASLVLFFAVGPSLMSPPSPSVLIALILASLVLSFCVAVFGTRRLRRRRSPDATRRPQFGAEKQLLMVLRDAGSITPVRAALETSLTVDEAEEVLSRLANRGHLHVESRDGTLFYVLPGGRHASKR